MAAMRLLQLRSTHRTIRNPRLIQFFSSSNSESVDDADRKTNSSSEVEDYSLKRMQETYSHSGATIESISEKIRIHNGTGGRSDLPPLMQLRSFWKEYERRVISEPEESNAETEEFRVKSLKLKRLSSMDREDSSNPLGKGGMKRQGERNSRRVWNEKEEETLLNALHELCFTGWKQKSNFTGGYLLTLENQLARELPGADLKATHIMLKIKAWRKKYNDISSIIGKFGIEWNKTTKTIDCPSDSLMQWELLVKEDPSLKGARHKPIQYYDQWCNIFGETTERSVNSVNAMEQEEMGPNSVTFDDMYYPTNRADKTRENEIKHHIMATVISITKVLNSFFEQHNERMTFLCKTIGCEHDLNKARKMIYREVEKMTSLCKRIGYIHDVSEARKKFCGAISDIKKYPVLCKRIRYDHHASEAREKKFYGDIEKMTLLCKRIWYEHDVSEARKKIYGEIEKTTLLCQRVRCKADLIRAGGKLYGKIKEMRLVCERIGYERDLIEASKKICNLDAYMANLCRTISDQLYLSDASEKIYEEIDKLKLKKSDKSKVVTLIGSDLSKMDIFLTLPDDECKQEWVYLLLCGYI